MSESARKNNGVFESHNAQGDRIRRHPTYPENQIDEMSVSRTLAVGITEPSEIPADSFRAQNLPQTAERRQPNLDDDFARRLETSVMRLDFDQTGQDYTVLNNQGEIRLNTRGDLNESHQRIEAHQTGIELTQMTYIHPMDRAARLNVTPLEEEYSEHSSEDRTDSTDSE